MEYKTISQQYSFQLRDKMLKFWFIVVGVLIRVYCVKSWVLLEPREVGLCPGSQSVVNITCNVSGDSLSWRINAPQMRQDSVTIPGGFNPALFGVPIPFAGPLVPDHLALPGISMIVHSASSTSVSSSVMVDTSHYTLTGSRIHISCNEIAVSSIRLWGMKLL